MAAPKGESPSTTKTDTDRDPRWAALTAPFPEDWIEKLPKILSREDKNRGKCEDTPRGRQYSADGHFCNGYHARAVHLDYVGHAGITMRLNDAVGPENWTWEPYTNTPDGLPGWRNDEFWIKLTILGVTKIGVGDDSRSPKVLIGDALRNAAMRFGVGTYLWSKSDAAAALASFAEPAPEPPAPAPEQRQQGRQQTGPSGEAERPGQVDAGDLPDTAVVKAHMIAATKATDLGALRDVWDQACAAGTVGQGVDDPDEVGHVITVGDYITRRKHAMEAEQRPAA